MLDKIIGTVSGAIKNVGQSISSLDPSNIRKSIAGFTNFNIGRPQGTSISYVGSTNGGAANDWRVYLIDRDGYLVGKYETFAMLRETSNGIVFPYTPNITMSYNANYEMIQGVQTNYATPTYQQSNIGTISIRGVFTANSRNEGRYLLSALHFLRSATKSRFGSDPNAGTPPPILYLRGYGEGMFNDVPVVVTNVNYTLPADTDYIDIGNPEGEALQSAQDQAYTVTRDDEGNILPGLEQADVTRINARLNLEAGFFESSTPLQNTKVPTEIEIDIGLQVIYKRIDQATLSSEEYYNGNLIKNKGFL